MNRVVKTMRRWGYAILLCLLVQHAQAADWNYLSQSLVKWQRYEKATFDLARRNKQPLFILIYSDQCSWCRKYELESIETDEILRRLQQDFVPVAVDTLRQPDLAKKLGAAVVPTTLLLTPGGARMAKFHGYVDKRDLADILDANLYRWRRGELTPREFGNESTCCPLSGSEHTPIKK